jgi:hypothetical protein
MKKIDIKKVEQFVKENIQTFHANRLRCLEGTDLKNLLKRKNPYLFKAKNILRAQDLVLSFLDAQLSSSEEKIFGDFLENLAIFVAHETLGAVKSSSHGIDFEYTANATRYLVTVKSGENWGNSSQWNQLETNFKDAMKVLKQSPHIKHVQNVIGISYGKSKPGTRKGIILMVSGQSFWYMISGDEKFYTKIVEPLGYRARELNESFKTKKAGLVNKFTKEFIEEFCDREGKILWDTLVEYNSGNLTPEQKTRLKP